MKQHIILCHCGAMKLTVDPECSQESVADSLRWAVEHGYSSIYRELTADDWKQKCTCEKEEQLKLFEV